MSTLFREEVFANKRDLWLGEAQLRTSTTGIATFAGILFCVALVALICFGSYTRHVHAEGSLDPAAGLITLASPIAGRLTSAKSDEGGAVKKGQLLFTVDVDAVSAKGPTQIRVIANLEAQKTSLQRERQIALVLAALEKSALRNEIVDLTRQHKGMVDEIAVQSDLSQPLKARADQLQAALSSGLVRAADFQNQHYLLIQSTVQLAQLDQQRLQLEAKITQTKATIEQFDGKLDGKIAEMDRSIAQLDQQIAESQAKSAIEVRAPEDGILTSFRVHAGQEVAAGAPLVTLLPAHARLQANLYLDSSAIGFIKPGAAAVLSYKSFPYQRFGFFHGRVAEVTRAPITDAVNQSSSSDGLFRVIVEPDVQSIDINGSPRALAAGMRVDADISLEKRRVFSWLFSPMSRLRQKAQLIVAGDAK